MTVHNRNQRRQFFLSGSQNYGPFLAIDYIMAPTISGTKMGPTFWELPMRVAGVASGPHA